MEGVHFANALVGYLSRYLC